MKISILHLSDIHIKEENNFILNRIDRIASALVSSDPEINKYLVIVSGDVAFSGKTKEYNIAIKFFDELIQKLKDKGSIYTRLVIAPGNHDCDFDNEKSIRKILIENRGYRELSPDDDSVLNEYLNIQDDYFTLCGCYSAGNFDQNINKLYISEVFAIDDIKIKINIFNTAWISKLHEKQGDLYYPLDLIENTISDKRDNNHLCISVFHHPYNWLMFDNAKKFKKYVESISDIIITGHEHDSGIYKIENISGELNEYIEGACLQDHINNKSGFNVLLIDLETNLQNPLQYIWNGELYEKARDTQWHLFIRNKKLNQREFENCNEFIKFLEDPGAKFTHRYKDDLRLNDIFIFPDLLLHPLEKDNIKNVGNYIMGESAIENINKYQYSIFIGADKSGKTAIAKILYLNSIKLGDVPIFLNGEKINNHNTNKISNLINNNFAEQYSGILLEKYLQLDKKNRVLIIDDFDKARLNEHGRFAFLEYSKLFFNKIIIIVNDVYIYQEIIDIDPCNNYLFDFVHFRIMGLGHRLREKLIEKWLYLGQEYTADIKAIDHKVDKSQKLIDNILGRNLIPAYPIFILSILQSMEANIHLNMASGAYGYFYELLINQALSLDKSNITFDTNITFLAYIAYYIFNNKLDGISMSDISKINSEYHNEYKIEIPLMNFLDNMLNIAILAKYDSLYRFKYRYVFYYFVAKFFQENLKDKLKENLLREELNNITDKIYIESYANILIFLIYLTKDNQLISQILSNSQKIYNDFIPCDFDKDIEFFNNLQNMLPDFILPESDPKTNREQMYASFDEMNSVTGNSTNESDSNNELITEEEEANKIHSDVLKLNEAFKYLQVLGQILRNFPGSLKADIKYHLASECYGLGLRTLNSFFKLFEKHLDIIREAISSEIKDKKDEEKIEIIDNFIYGLGLLFSCGMVKNISNSIGSENLKETLSELVGSNDTNSSLLIDISIKLDHYKNIPEKEIVALAKKIEKNIFSFTVLKILTYEYLYFHRHNYRSKQIICSALKIKTSDPLLIDNKSR